jgi:hypothetical protein
MKYSNKFWYNTFTKETRVKKPGLKDLDCNQWEHWDSSQEFNFYYKVLLPICRQLDLEVVRQYRLVIAESRYVGKLFWIPDFMLFNEKTPIIPIEFKGDWILTKSGAIGALKSQLALCEIKQKNLFPNLILISSPVVKKRLQPPLTVILEERVEELYAAIKFRKEMPCG